MTIWTPRITHRAGPAYRRIAAALGEDIALGRLTPGERLPTHRDLAERLGVTVGTVTRAYAEAARLGLVRGEVGRGTYVLAPEAAARATADAPPAGALDPDCIDLRLNYPPLPGAADRATLADGLRRVAARDDLAALFGYQAAAGTVRHRAAGAAWLARLGLPAEPERVLVCSGAQHGLAVALAAVTAPGDVVLTEALTYGGVKSVAQQYRLRLHGLEMDVDGLRPDAFERACRELSPRALYCMPTLQNPTATVMTETRRRELAAVAARHDVLIVEDDLYAPLFERPPAPIARFAPERTCYVTSLSKWIAPGLRVGYVLAPARLVPELAARIQATVWMAAPLLAELAATWLEDDTARHFLTRQREEARARQRIAAELLPRPFTHTHPVSHHVWLRLPEPWRGEAFAAAALRRGVGVLPAERFVVGRAPAPHAARVCLGAAASHDTLRRGLEILAGLLHEPPPPAPTFV